MINNYKIKIIKNINSSLCINCKNYIINIKNTDQGTCSIFSKKNLVTGKIEQDSAITCRQDEYKCGLSATHYIPSFNNYFSDE